MEVTLHEYFYDELSGLLDVYFSMDSDEPDTQRMVSFNDFEIVKYSTTSVTLSDLSISDIVTQDPYILDVLVLYIENNIDNLPNPEYT